MSRASGRKLAQGQSAGIPSNGPSITASNVAIAEKPGEVKDATELELEKLLFGDDLGFLNNVAEHNQELALLDDYGSEDYENESAEVSGEDEADDFGGLRDEDLFVVDAGPATERTEDQTALLPFKPTNEEEDGRIAWEDSDDERLNISLASHSRLRKLRHTEAEDSITGKEYAQRLREQYLRLHPTPEWAQTTKHRNKRRRVSEDLDKEGSEVAMSDDDHDMDEDLSAQPLAQLLQSAESLLDSSSSEQSGKVRPLRPGTIEIQRLRDVSNSSPSAISSLSFHPSVSPPLLLSSGPSGLLSMHHISAISGSGSKAPTTNPLLTSLAVPSLAIDTSSFHSSGSRIFFAGRRRYFHVWDLPSGTVSRVTNITGNRESQRSCENFKLSPCGRYMALVGTARKGGGVANILDATTGQWIAQARVEGRNGVSDVAWWSDGEGLAVLSKGGEIIEYSVAEKRVIGRWRDEGAVGSTVIELGGQLPGYKSKGIRKATLGPDHWVAVGSQSGIVNIYDRTEWRRDGLDENPTPRKVLSQLVTPIGHLSFSPDGQLLVMASKWKNNALRLIHLPSCTVYKNWPTSNSPLGRITSIAWAGSSRLLAIGNEAGNIRLWEVRG